MGLFQKAVETYDKMSHLAGVEVSGKEVLAPIGHITTKASIIITIDRKGKFNSATARAAEEPKVCIPVTEASSGRTSAPAAHPLCDNLKYVAPITEKEHPLYLEQLKRWCASEYASPKTEAVLQYVLGGTILSDLDRAGLLSRDAKGEISNGKDLVCWSVEGLGEESGPVWTDRKLMELYRQFYLSDAPGENTLCYVNGNVERTAEQHMKGVVSLFGNAKIISSNDTSNFTYRGRFETGKEAASISYTASQKAHNALKWLASNQGVSIGGRRLVCWNPSGISVPKPILPLLKQTETPPEPTEYRQLLQKTVEGYKAQLPDKEGIVIASFEAATSGRLSVTYYNELTGSDFLERLKYWDETCCWYDTGWGTSAPLLYNIVNYAFGTARSSATGGQKIECDDAVMAQHMQRLLSCRVDRALFPLDIEKAIAEKAGNLQIYSLENRRKLLFTACAVIRKYKKDRYKEEWDMALEPERKDRSYQYGRLLAVLEKAEKDTYDREEGRETNAIRMQSVFVKRPAYAASIIMDRVKSAYYPHLKPGIRNYYEKLIGEIYAVISEFPEQEIGKPLSETYLMGYYLQKNALYSKKEIKTEENENE